MQGWKQLTRDHNCFLNIARLWRRVPTEWELQNDFIWATVPCLGQSSGWECGYLNTCWHQLVLRRLVGLTLQEIMTYTGFNMSDRSRLITNFGIEPKNTPVDIANNPSQASGLGNSTS